MKKIVLLYFLSGMLVSFSLHAQINTKVNTDYEEYLPELMEEYKAKKRKL